MHNFLRICARFLFGKLLPRVAYPVIHGPLKGAKFILGSMAGDGGGATVYFNMVEYEQTNFFVNTLKTGQILFDIGANVGYYSILGSRLVGPQGRVFAFEPVIRNVAYLYQHTILNNAHNITIISAACSHQLSLTTFSLGGNFATGHISNNLQSQKDSSHLVIPVPTITVDALVEQLGITPDVIKIDVEGAEYSVLLGSQTTLRNSKPKIFLSTHSSELRTNCLEYLKGIGYKYEILSQDKDNPSEFFVTY